MIYSEAKAEESQYAMERWTYGGSNMKYTQLSLFTDRESNIYSNKIIEYKHKIDNALISASIDVNAQSSDIWKYAYSTQTKLPNTSVQNAKTSVSVAGVGGDFFIFHPMTLINGVYFNESNLITDTVVIDEGMAWQAFGSYDVAGLEIFINNIPFTVSGVAARKYDDLSIAAYGDSPHIFMQYNALTQVMGQELPITCYEVILPNLISSFAMNIFKAQTSIPETNGYYLENTNRFSIINLYNNMAGFNKRGMRIDLVNYPYWENIAVVRMDTCSILLFFNTIVLILILCFTIFQIVFLAIKYDLTFKHLKNVIINYKKK